MARLGWSSLRPQYWGIGSEGPKCHRHSLPSLGCRVSVLLGPTDTRVPKEVDPQLDYT